MADIFADNIFNCIFLNENYFNSNFTEICSQESNWKEASIGSGNGLAQNITNDGPVLWHIYAVQGRDGNKPLLPSLWLLVTPEVVIMTISATSDDKVVF